MQITLICCPFETSYGAYAGSLKASLERKIGETVHWVGANCGCGDPMEVNRSFHTKECTYFEMPVPGQYRSTHAWRRQLRGWARNMALYLRARRYATLSKDAEIVHFQQVLNGYGSRAVFHWLKQPAAPIKIVTVHELDADQLDRPQTNETYNLADAILVHCEEMRRQLIQLKTDPGRIHVVPYGVELPTTALDGPREGIVFYGGHKLASGKGLDTLFHAMAILEHRIPNQMPAIRIHGHYGDTTPPEATLLARQMGVEHRITWLNQLPSQRMVELYCSSRICVLPYTRGFAGLPATLAAACGLPVVCTRAAGLPDHLGDDAIWMDMQDPKQLAEQIITLLSDATLCRRIGARLRQRAELFLNWDVIADRTLEIYAKALANKKLSTGRAA